MPQNLEKGAKTKNANQIIRSAFLSISHRLRPHHYHSTYDGHKFKVTVYPHLAMVHTFHSSFPGLRCHSPEPALCATGRQGYWEPLQDRWVRALGEPGSIAFSILWEVSSAESRRSRFMRNLGDAFALAVSSSSNACVIFIPLVFWLLITSSAKPDTPHADDNTSSWRG